MGDILYLPSYCSILMDALSAYTPTQFLYNEVSTQIQNLAHTNLTDANVSTNASSKENPANSFNPSLLKLMCPNLTSIRLNSMKNYGFSFDSKAAYTKIIKEEIPNIQYHTIKPINLGESGLNSTGIVQYSSPLITESSSNDTNVKYQPEEETYNFTYDHFKLNGKWKDPMIDGKHSANKAIYDAWNNPLHRGSMHIFAFVDWLNSFEFKVVSKSSAYDLQSNLFDPEQMSLELDLWDDSKENLYWSVILDKKSNSANYENPYNNDWTKAAYNRTTFFRYVLPMCPETVALQDGVIKDYVMPFTTPLFSVLFNAVVTESFSIPIIDILAYLVVVLSLVYFIVFLFSYYDNPNSNDNTIDSDYLVSSMTVESEEEIASTEDLSLGLYLLVFMFGWYFYMNGAFILSNLPETAVIIYNAPSLFYMIAFMPLFLLYDFGIFFLSYLRGSSSTLSLMMELLYDYIAVAAFFIRLLVQNVRILLMIFVYFSFYEYMQFYSYMDFAFYNFDSIWEFNDYNANESVSFYFLFKLTSFIVYLVYELLHTFFVVTAQFTAFFAMVFWLFLFLFTMFSVEKHEKFFSEKLEKRKRILKELLRKLK